MKFFKNTLLTILVLGLFFPYSSQIFAEKWNKNKLKKELAKLRKHPAIHAACDTIAAAEGTDFRESFYERPPIPGGSGGYKIRFPNTTFGSYKTHPEEVLCAPLGGKEWCSSAAGRYQFLGKTWKWISEKLQLRDFSPRNQDLAAIYLIKIKGAIKDIIDENIEEAIKKLNGTWASFPGSPYGQPMHSMEKIKKFFYERLLYHKEGK